MPRADYGPVEQRKTVMIEELRDGVRVIGKRARRADPLDRVQLPTELRCAAVIFRQAAEHVEAGRGMGPLPWGRDFVGQAGEALPAQMRALSAATMYRQGVQAAGQAADGVCNWVILRGLPLHEYDALRRWREGRGKAELHAALQRMAVAYGLVMSVRE